MIKFQVQVWNGKNLMISRSTIQKGTFFDLFGLNIETILKDAVKR